MTEPHGVPPAPFAPPAPPPPAEAHLLQTALAAKGLSQRQAAHAAGISESRWRQIVSGYQAVSGSKAPVRSPGATLARMAQVVGVTPEQLESAGRADAAGALRDLVAAGSVADPASSAQDFSRVDERWHMLEALLRQAGAGLSPEEYGTLLDRISLFLSHRPERQPPQDATASVPGKRARGRRG
jgi:transcriptional regulator with XRE-family HTH domain